MRTATAKLTITPTREASKLYFNTDDNRMTVGAETPSMFPEHRNQFLYLTLNETPQLGEWWINTIDPTRGVHQANEHEVTAIKRKNSTHCQKISATNDPSILLELGEPSQVKRIHDSFLHAYAKSVNENQAITSVEIEVEDVLLDPAFVVEPGKLTKMVVKTRPSDDTVIIHQEKKYTKADVRAETIAFALWYSGMVEEKVNRAYERYLKEKEGII